MKKRIVIYIILAQIAIVILLVFNIYHKKQTLGVASVNPIRQDEIISSPSSELKHFYEPKPDSVQVYIVKIPNENKSYLGKSTINPDSLNDRFNYSVDKPKNIFRIITLGDSFTFGAYVDTKDNWTELLEDKLNSDLKCTNVSKFEVINLGVGGYDAAYSVERFRRRGQKYNPDMVIWLHVDLLRITEEMGPLQNKYLSNAKSSAERNEMIKKGKVWYEVRNRVLAKYGEESNLKFQEKEIKSLDEYFQGKLVLFTSPAIDEKMNEILKNIMINRKDGYFGGRIEEISSQGMHFPDGHPNQKGHQMIAEDIFNYLKTNSLIPCN